MVADTNKRTKRRWGVVLEKTPRGRYLFSKAMSLAAKKLKEENPKESKEMERYLKGEPIFSPGGYLPSKALYLASRELKDKEPVEAEQMELLLEVYSLYPAIEKEKKLVKKLVEEHGDGPFPFFTILGEHTLCRISKDEEDDFTAESWDYKFGWHTGLAVSLAWEGRKITQLETEQWIKKQKKQKKKLSPGID